MAKKDPHHGNKWMPCMYVTYYGMLKDIAMKHGYALAVHGTVTRDFDLIAVPWIERPKPVISMLKEFADVIGYCYKKEPYSLKSKKNHGRMSYTFLTGSGGYIDLSVMPLNFK